MNKIKFLILALLCCVGSSAWGEDIKNGSIYYINSGRGTDKYFHHIKSSNTDRIHLDQKVANDPNFMWYFVADNDSKVNLYNLVDGSKWGYPNTNNAAGVITTNVSGDGSGYGYDIVSSGNTDYPWALKITENRYLSNNGGVGNNMGIWSGLADTGTYFKVELIAEQYDIYTLVINNGGTASSNSDNTPNKGYSFSNGQKMIWTSTPQVSDIQPGVVGGYQANTPVIDTTNKTITVNYSEKQVEYTVHVIGCTSGSVKYSDVDYSDGKKIQVTGAIGTPTVNEVSGYNSFVTVEGLDIYAVYHVTTPVDGKAYMLYHKKQDGTFRYYNYKAGESTYVSKDRTSASVYAVASTGHNISAYGNGKTADYPSYYFKTADGNYLTWQGNADGFKTDGTNRWGYSTAISASQDGKTDWAEMLIRTENTKCAGTISIGARRSNSTFSTLIISTADGFNRADFSDFYDGNNSNAFYLVEKTDQKVVKINVVATDNKDKPISLPEGISVTFKGQVWNSLMPYFMYDGTFNKNDVEAVLAGYTSNISDLADNEVTVTFKSDAELFDITYNYFYNSKKIRSDVFEVTSGDPRPQPQYTGLPYGTWSANLDAAEVPATITENGEYNLNLSYSAPIIFSTNYASATWYTMKMRSGYAGFDGTNFPETSSDSQPIEAKNMFAFVGDPFSFKILFADKRYVKNNGENNELSTLDETGTNFSIIGINTGNYTFTIEGKIGTINDVNKNMGFWAATAAYSDGGSSIILDKATDVKVYSIEFAEGAPAGAGAYYEAGNVTIMSTDALKAFTATSELTKDAVTAKTVNGYSSSVALSDNVFTITYITEKSQSWKTLNNTITEAKAMSTPTGPWGTDPGFYNQTAVEALPGAITTAEAVLNDGTATDQQLDEANATLIAAVNAASRIKPVVGHTYQLVSAYTGFSNNMAIYSDGTGLRWKVQDYTDKSMYWTVTAVDGNNITFKNLKDNKYPTGYTTANQSIPVSNTENYCIVSWYDDGQCSIKSNGSSAMFHAGDHGGGTSSAGRVMVYNAEQGSCSAWYIREKTIVDLTYNVKENENIICSLNFVGVQGEALPQLSVPAAFGTIQSHPSGNVSTETTEYDVTYQSNIKCFADLKDVNTWYALDVHKNLGNLTVYDNEGSLSVNTNTPEYKNGAVLSKSYFWAFIGNPFTGVKLYNSNSGEYITHPSNDATATFSDGTETATFQVYTGSFENSFALKIEGYSNYLNHQGTSLKGWGSTDQGSSFRAFQITDGDYSIEQTVKANKYGTIIIPFYSQIPTGLKVYTCSQIVDNQLDLVEVTDIMKPGTPYIVENTTSGDLAVTYQNTSKLTEPGTSATSGLLTGTYQEISNVNNIDGKSAGNIYILKTQNDKQGFYQLDPETDYKTLKIGANRCYLTWSDSSVKALFMDDFTPTGISSAVDDLNDSNSQMYNLSGQTVGSGYKGIVIKNGKKYLYK